MVFSIVFLETTKLARQATPWHRRGSCSNHIIAVHVITVDFDSPF